MGEAKMRDAKAMNGSAAIADLVANEQKVSMLPHQVAVITTVDRAIAMLQVDAGQLAEVWQQRQAAGEVAAAIEHLAKFRNRYFVERQRAIVVPEVKVVLK